LPFNFIIAHQDAERDIVMSGENIRHIVSAYLCGRHLVIGGELMQLINVVDIARRGVQLAAER